MDKTKISFAKAQSILKKFRYKPRNEWSQEDRILFKLCNFSVLSKKRLNNVLTTLQRLAKLSDKSHYKYSELDIKLIKESHKYEHSKHRDLKFTSVTSFVENFFEKFDSFKIAKKLIKNYKIYSNHTVESLITKWNETANYGTFVHEELENWVKYQIIPKEKKIN